MIPTPIPEVRAAYCARILVALKPARDASLTKNGVALSTYDDVKKSIAVQTKINNARQKTGAYKVDGVPMLFVNGKYITSNTHAKGDTARIMVIVDQLVDKARKEMAGAK